MKEEDIYEKKGDGSVWRKATCDCGNVIYKKNLTTGTIQFLSVRKTPKNVRQIPVNNVCQNEVFCENCGAGHIVIEVEESINLS